MSSIRLAARALLVALAAFIPFAAAVGDDDTFDLVLKGGRVIDPETSLDAIRNIGIRGDTIARVSEKPLHGKRVLDVSGLVVAPGFIDLHQHGFDKISYRCNGARWRHDRARARDRRAGHRAIQGRS